MVDSRELLQLWVMGEMCTLIFNRYDGRASIENVIVVGEESVVSLPVNSLVDIVDFMKNNARQQCVDI